MQKSRFLGCFKELKTSPLYASALSSDSISSHIYSKVLTTKVLTKKKIEYGGITRGVESEQCPLF